MKPISPLHILTDPNHLMRSVLDQVKTAVASHAPWIQLRMKGMEEREMLDIAHIAVNLCRDYHTKLIINDYVSIAKVVGADGVHLGREDMEISLARTILGDKAIIGGTAHTRDEVLSLLAQDVDYIGIGPFRNTLTKTVNAPVLGVAGLREIVLEFPNVPFVAIGGVTLDDIHSLSALGLAGVAVTAAIQNSEFPEETIYQFLRNWNSGVLQHG